MTKSRLFRWLFSGLLGWAGLLISPKVHAQVQDVEVQITNPLKVTLPAAERNFDKIPVKPLEPVYPPLIYGFRSIPFAAPPFKAAVRPLRLREPENEDRREGYASLGYGNYGSLFGDIFFPVYQNSKIKTSSSLRAYHNSFSKGPVEGNRSASGTSSINLDFRSSGKSISVEGLVGYQNNFSNFYGYPEGTNLNNDTLGISYSDVHFGARFLTARKSNHNYSLDAGFSHLWNNRKASESDLRLAFKGSSKVGDKGEIKVNADYDLLAREDVSAQPKPRNLVNVRAAYSFDPVSDLHLEIGVNSAFENDTLVEKSFHAYPSLYVKWKLMPRITLEGNLGGQVEKVSLHTLAASNLWLDRNVLIGHNNQLLDFNSALQIGLGSGWSASAGFRYTDLDNMFFFVNQAYDSSRFDVLYDDATRINPSLGVNFQKGKLSTEIKMDYFIWNLSNLTAPFHKPEGRVEWNAVLAFSRKFHFQPYALLLWGIQAPVASDSEQTLRLPAATDLGFRFNYNFSDRGTAFVRVNNLLGSSYTLLQNYPVRGFQGLAGISWRF